MNKGILKKYTHLLVYLVIIFYTTSACTKTEYEQLERPYTDILHFEIDGYSAESIIEGVVDGDSILLYWSGTVEKPATVSPRITVSEGASVSPAAGEKVPFAAGTPIKVTAANGTAKTYFLKPVLQTVVPILLEAPTSIGWIDTKTIRLTGEYFSSRASSSIKVYAQRLKDGYEFDMPVIESSVQSTRFDATVPDFSIAQDTGWHKIWVKIGDQVSGTKDVYFAQPSPNNLKRILSLEQEGQPVHPGQELTLNYALSDDYEGAVTRYYLSNFVYIYVFIEGIPEIITATAEAQNITYTNSLVKFTLPPEIEQYAGAYISRIMVRPRRPLVNNPDYVASYQYNLRSNKTVIVRK